MNTVMKLLTASFLVVGLAVNSAVARTKADGTTTTEGVKKSGGAHVSRMYVAIDKFDNKAGVDANQFGTIRARIQEAVVGTRKFEVVEREQLGSVLREQNLVAAGMTNADDPNAPRAGELKAAGFVIYGNVMFLGADRGQVQLEGAASTSVRIKLELQIKIADASTGRILAQKSVVGVGKESRVATSSSAAAGNLVEQSTRAAAADAAHRVVDALRDVSYPAKIIKFGKKEVMVNMTDVEAALGDLFDVVESGEEVFDPDTGASLGSDGEVVGRIQISRPGAKMSGAKAVSYWDIDEHEMCEFKLKELNHDTTYIVRRISAARLDAEADDMRKNMRDNQGSQF